MKYLLKQLPRVDDYYTITISLLLRVRVVVPVKGVQPAVFAHQALVSKETRFFTHANVPVSRYVRLIRFD